MIEILTFLVLSVVFEFIWINAFYGISKVRFSNKTLFQILIIYMVMMLTLTEISILFNIGYIQLLGICTFPMITFIFQFKSAYRRIHHVSFKFFYSFYSFTLAFLLFWLYSWAVNTVLDSLHLSFDFTYIRALTISLLSSVLTVLTHYWIILVTPAKIYVSHPIIRKNIKEVNIFLLIVYLAVTFAYMNEVYIAKDGISEPVKYMMFLFISILIILFFYLTFKSQLAAKEEINQLQKTQLDNLAVYTEEIEKMYQTLRGFRHDYQNVLLSLQESIDSEDIEQIKQVYHDILASADVRLVRQIESTNVNELANIHDSAVKSVMFWKITQARDRKVAVDVEIKEELPQLWMSSLHFIRIFSILMDNAIEEAKRTDTPKISIALFVNQGDIIFTLSNSTLLDSIHFNLLQKPGYTTKGRNRGIGLSNVNEILRQYSNCYLETELENRIFTQRLVMEGIEEE